MTFVPRKADGGTCVFLQAINMDMDYPCACVLTLFASAWAATWTGLNESHVAKKTGREGWGTFSPLSVTVTLGNHGRLRADAYGRRRTVLFSLWVTPSHCITLHLQFKQNWSAGFPCFRPSWSVSDVWELNMTIRGKINSSNAKHHTLRNLQGSSSTPLNPDGHTVHLPQMHRTLQKLASRK